MRNVCVDLPHFLLSLPPSYSNGASAKITRTEVEGLVVDEEAAEASPRDEAHVGDGVHAELQPLAHGNQVGGAGDHA